MKTLITVLLSAASLTMLFGSPDPQTEPEVSVPGIVSTSSDNGGMRTRADTDLPSVRYGSHIDLNQPGVTLEQLDARSLTLEPNQIGVNRSVEVSPNTRAQKFVNPDGSQLIVLIIKSSGASGVGVHFRNFALADGEEVYVYGASADSIVFGPFTDKGPWGSGEFWSGTVDGDTVVIEYYKKTDENGQGFEIFEISHIFPQLDWQLRSNEPDVLNCELDASCYGDNEKNAVGRIMFNANGGTYICTGTLLNNVAQDHTAYFLTANHCVDSQTVAQTVEVDWFYQTTSCNSGVLRPSVHTGPGANLLTTQSSNDFSLLRLLNNAPGGAVFSAWTSAAQSTGTSVFGLHHPDGYSPPYIQSYLRRSSGSITNTNESCLDLVDAYGIHWTAGATEPGSSGSGLWNSSHRLIGLDSCGNHACAPNGYTIYSKLANFYPQIRQYIGSLTPSSPVANPATFVASHSFRANWRSVNGATGYRLDVATNNSFTNYVAGYQNLNVGNTLSRSVTGLNASTTYHYRVRAYNGNGTSGNSNVVHVTTISPTGPPAAITNPATLITSASARLNGTVDPHGLSTTVYFQYGRTTSYGSRTPNQTKTGNNEQNVVANISGLSAGTTYHFRIVASNALGTRYGADRTFTPTGPPAAITNPATLIASDSARLNGTVDPHGLSTTVYFQYGRTTSYGSRTPNQTKTGNNEQNVFANISGLGAHTTYHFRIVTTNGGGTRYGSDRTFTTLTAPPVVTTNPATNVTRSSARLHGSLDPQGLTTSVYFQYGTTTSYGYATPMQSQTGNTSQNIAANISGLATHTTYHFRIVAHNSAGTRYGSDRTFTTLATSVPTPTPTATPTPTPTPIATATATPTATATATPTATPTVTPTPCVPGTWSTSSTGPPARYRAGGCTDGTNVYVYGGGNSTGGYYNDLWRWNPNTQTWTQLANMPTAKQNIQGAYWNGKIYVPGGFNGVHIIENAIYDIATNTWSTGAPLPWPKSGQQVAFNNQIYNFGGNPDSQETVTVYDIASNTWSTRSSMPIGITYGRATVAGNFAYYVGGAHDGMVIDTVYRYDFAADRWATMAPLQTARISEELMTSPDNTKLFAVMGGDATFFTGVPLPVSVELYDIASNTWSYGNPVVTKAAAPSGGLAGGKAIVGSGLDGTAYYDTVQVSLMPCGGADSYSNTDSDSDSNTNCNAYSDSDATFTTQ